MRDHHVLMLFGVVFGLLFLFQLLFGQGGPNVLTKPWAWFWTASAVVMLSEQLGVLEAVGCLRSSAEAFVFSSGMLGLFIRHCYKRYGS